MEERMDFKLELVIVPVADVDRSKAFYTERAGWNLDVHMHVGGGMRVVQLTPPGSTCSVGIGTGITDATPGAYRGIHLVVTDIVAAREELVGRGVEISEVRHIEDGAWRTGPHPGRGDYQSYADFTDPDGNAWVLQERDHPQRQPDRSTTT
jgi:catechol 2,3-dioxygenase-like lactoylglutathione lyase family enzyme